MRHTLQRLSERHPIFVYTLARLGLLLVVLLPLAALGFRGVALFGLAILISGALALFVLDGARAKFSGRMSGYFARINKRIDDATRAEDDDDEPVVEAPRPQASADQGKAEA